MEGGRTSNYLPFLPFIAALWQFSLVATSYAVGIFLNKRLTYFPYPSDLGISQPEKGLFHAGLNIGGTLTFSVMLLRYIQINSLYPKQCRRTNIFSFFCGIMMVLGQLTVVTYTLDELMIAHFIAASFYFIFGTLYMLTQTLISRHLKQYHNNCIQICRMCCSIIGVLCPVAYTCGRFLAPVEESRYEIPQSAEWLLSLLLIVFIATFSWDFNRIRYRCYNMDLYPMNQNGIRGTNYIDYLRRQARTRRSSNGHVAIVKNSNF